MHVTVALCTWNRSALLRQTLAPMAELRVPPGLSWQLLIIDNNCTDDTPAVVASFSGLLPLDRIEEKAQGLSNARNRALAEANGSHILFTDEDVLVDRAWLASFCRAVQTYPDAAAFGGPIRPLFAVPPDPILVEAFPELKAGFCGLDYGLPEGLLEERRDIFGANMGFRMDAVGDIQFNPDLGLGPHGRFDGEEVDFVRRLRAEGGRVVWVPDMRVERFVEPTRARLQYLLKFCRDRGRGAVQWEGTPEGRAVGGVPLWLIRRWAGTATRSAFWWLTRKRLRCLVALRRAEYWRGMIQECWESRRGRGVHAGCPGG